MSDPHSDLTAEIQAGRLTTQQALGRIAVERDGDARALQIPCEAPGCGKLHLLTRSYSACLWLAFTGHPAVSGYQMSEQPDRPGSYPHQHFCCSAECLEQTVILCLREHLHPETARRAAALVPASTRESHEHEYQQ